MENEIKRFCADEKVRDFFEKELRGLTDGYDLLRITCGAADICVELSNESNIIYIEIWDSSKGGDFIAVKNGMGLRLRQRNFDKKNFDIASAVFERLSSHPLTDLIAAVMPVQSIASGKSEEGESSGAQDPAMRDFFASRIERYNKKWRHSDDWWKFYYPTRNISPFLIDSGLTIVHHSTLECCVSDQLHTIPSLSYFGQKAFSASKKPNPGSTVFTVLSEKDVLMGRTLAKLEKTIRKVSSDEKVKSIHIMTTCLPDLIGDNPLPIIREMENRGNLKIFWTSKTHNSSEFAEALYRSALEAFDFDEERDDKKVVLGGVLSHSEKEEFSGFLKDLFGITVTGFMLPEYDLDAYPDIRKARTLVWVNPSGWTHVEDSIFKGYFQIVRAGTPYGVENTLNWLKGVRDKLSPDTSDSEIEEFYQRKFRQGIEEIRSQCSDYTVALIGDASDLDYLSTANGFCGFSVYHILLEMGFKVRRFVYGTPVPGAESFDSREKLRDLIAGEVDAVFSSFNYDPRVNGAGKNCFSENIFEPGFYGFARSAERILRLCKLAPFARFRKFLD